MNYIHKMFGLMVPLPIVLIRDLYKFTQPNCLCLFLSHSHSLRGRRLWMVRPSTIAIYGFARQGRLHHFRNLCERIKSFPYEAERGQGDVFIGSDGHHSRHVASQSQSAPPPIILWPPSSPLLDLEIVLFYECIRVCLIRYNPSPS